jgi:hypothetical protein
MYGRVSKISQNSPGSLVVALECQQPVGLLAEARERNPHIPAAVLPAMMRRRERRGEFEGVTDLFQHRALPSRVFSPPLLLSTAAAMLARRDCARPAVLREVGQLVMTDARRKRLRRKPVFVDVAAHVDAGETEVPQEAAA